jgi:hypothetical protein
MTKNWKKFIAEKNLIFLFFHPQGSIKVVQATVQEKPSVRQNMKFLDFFLFLRVIFVLLDPVPYPLTLYPDPKHWFRQPIL